MRTNKEALDRLYSAFKFFYPKFFDPNFEGRLPKKDFIYQGEGITRGAFLTEVLDFTGEKDDPSAAFKKLVELHRLSEQEVEGNVPRNLKELEETAEAEESKRKAAIEKSEADVRAAIEQQKQIYEDQIKKVEAAKKVIEEQTKQAKVQEVKLTEDQQKEFDLLQKEARATPKKAVEDVASEIKNNLGDSVSQKDAEFAAINVVVNLQSNFAPSINSAATEKIASDGQIKTDKEVLELIKTLYQEDAEKINLSKEIVGAAKGPDFQNAVFPKVEVSDGPQSGFIPVSPLTVSKIVDSIKQKSSVLDNPYLTPTDYANIWIGSQIENLRGDGSLVQGTVTFTTFRGHAGALPSSAEIQNRLNIATGVSEPLKAIGGIAGGVAKQAATKGITKAAVSLISKAAAPETAGLSLVVGQVVSWVADKIPWDKIKKWSAAIIGGLVGLAALPFVGLGAAIGIGAGTTALSFGLGGGLGSLTLGGVGAGIGSFFGALGRATLGAIGVPILATLIGFPVVVALILFIINSGAYVVPPAPLTLSSGATITSPYIGVSKVAVPPGPFENSQIPQTVEYQITIKAKKNPLTNIKIKYDCSVIKKQASAACPKTDPLIPSGIQIPESISPTKAFSFTYKQTLNLQDSLFTDTITVTADSPEQGGAVAAASAGVKIGNPPDTCPSGWPIAGSAPITQTAGGPFTHRSVEAIDIGVGMGTPIRTTHSGTAHVYRGGVYGPNYVDITSNCGGKEFISRYAHLQSVSVKNDQQVTMGQQLGASGTGGTGPHLHYEFRGLTMSPPYIPKSIPRGCSSDYPPCATIP